MQHLWAAPLLVVALLERKGVERNLGHYAHAAAHHKLPEEALPLLGDCIDSE